MDYIDELKTKGFTGDPDIDEILYTRVSIDKQREYERIMTGHDIPKGSGYSRIDNESVQSHCHSEYDTRMRELIRERDQKKGLLKAAFIMKHPELRTWENKQRKKAIDEKTAEVKVMTDNEIMKMAKRRA